MKWRYLSCWMFLTTTLIGGGGLVALENFAFGLGLLFFAWAFYFYYMPGYLGVKKEVR